MFHIWIYLVLALLYRRHVNAEWTTQSPDKRIQGPIFLSEPPTSLVFANTDTVFVPCTAFGRSAPVLEWIRDDGTVVDDVPGLLRVLSNNTLEFSSFDDADFRTDVHAQTYRCRATNSAGAIVSRSMRVKSVLVDDYKSYNLQLADEWAIKGSTATFKCIINPFFVKDNIKVIGWTQGTTPIVTGERVSIFPDGKLQIRDIRDEDRYTTYRCITRNVVTKEEKTSSFAYLHVIEPPAAWSPAKIEDFSKSLTVEAGKRVEMPCVGSGNPLPAYRWSFQGRDIVIDNSLFSQKGGNLVVTKADVENSGIYTCNVSNAHGTAIVTTQLVVTLPLTVHVTPHVQVVDSGQTAVFNCSVNGYPIKSITWFKNGLPLVADDRIKIQSGTLLTINDVTRLDQAMYQCVVQNEQDEAQGTSQLLLGVAHPAFIDTFADQYVQIGQRTSLKCVAAGNPTPSVSWSLDGQPLPQENPIKQGSFTNGFGDVVSYVNISRIKIQYGGEYVCSVKNDVGEISHSSKINIYGIPMVKPMSNITAVANRQLEIKCYVAGYPISTVSWSKDTILLPQNHLQHVVDGVLTIDKVQKKKDSGTYTCTAKNSNDQGSSQSVYVNVVDPPVIDRFSFPIKKQGDRIVVSCVVSSGDLPITIRWLKDGKKIPPDMGIRIQHIDDFTSMFSIGDASTKHSGNYTCEATNAAATAKLTAFLQVDVPPTWVIEPEDSFVILGKTVLLDCLTRGLPEPNISWKKALGASYEKVAYLEGNGSVSDRLQLFTNGTLVIRDAVESDHGHYLCHADNGVGYPLSKVIFLTVHIPARFDEPTKNYTVVKGQDITMDCQAIGDKPLAVYWSFNGKSLQDTHRKRIEKITTNRGLLSRLVFAPSERQDTGFYVCNANNKFGYGVLSMRLTVLEKPEQPINVTAMTVSSREVKVQWKKPYDGNSDIAYYIVEYIKNNGSWINDASKIIVASTDLSTNLNRLHPAYTYQIRVRANNSVGVSDPSQTVEITMLEEAPSGPPKDIVLKAIGSEAIQVTWKPPTYENINGKLLGYYIGYKKTSSPARFLYISKTIGQDFVPSHVLHNLEKFTEYSVHIQAYNAKGRGPPSPDYKAFTLEDVPSQPPVGVQATSINSRSIKIIWSPPPLYTLNGILQGYKILYQPVREDEDERDADTMITSNLEAIITGLSKYTNYSLQVLAYTRKGEGVRSPTIYVVTQQDVPERPSDIKALPVNISCILVSWRPPFRTNGIVTKYNLFVTSSKMQDEKKIIIPAESMSYLLTNMSGNVDYSFQVSANTKMGEGERTQKVSATVQDEASAKIASFSSLITIPWHYSVTLPCQTVGNPSPTVTWLNRNVQIESNSRIQILKNGSLYIDSVSGSDAANYTCKASNSYGTDQIIYTLSVQAPPKPPVISVVAGTSSTIQVNWKSGSNGGSPIKGFNLRFKKDHEDWKHVTFGPTNRSYTASGLMCGTMYRFIISANNSQGDSPNSNIVSVQTNGSTPIMAPQSMLLKSINITSVELDMASWLTSGCPIRFFSVKYKIWNDLKWTEVRNHIKANVTLFPVLDLLPATWYNMIVTAHSDAGSTESELKFSTLSYNGEPITPIYVSHKYERRFYEKEIVMIPLCAGVVSISVLLVGVLLYCKRRRELLRLKEISSNLRRDITAETSLMNDLDKRLNLEYDSSSGISDPFTKQNLFPSLNSDDNLLGYSPSWLFNSDSKTNSDNGSMEKSDEDGNINPYATFNEMHQMMKDQNEEMDDISLEKAAARRMMQMDPYVPFYKQKKKFPEKLAPIPPVKPPLENLNVYDNKGLALSPRKYASADQIHSLFTSSGQKPHHLYGRVRHTPYNFDDKASLRHSIISSITTVSSSRDELLEALENSRRHPPPVVYESQADDSSELTESPEESGILNFTQSPPHPNEQREASCQYRQSRDKQLSTSRGKPDKELDPVGYSKTGVPSQRRTRGKHKPKQKGQMTKKTSVKRTPSGVSTTSSEEITYTFDGEKDSPLRYSPSEGYLSYPHDSFADSEYSSHHQSGNTTPHTRTRYNAGLTTQGSDENKPLVALGPVGTSSQREEEEESVRLLDRHYRPVDEPRRIVLTDRAQRPDKGYTDDFTIV